MPRKPRRQKRRIGFHIDLDVEWVPAEPGPEVPGHYEEFTEDGELRQRRTRVHDSFVRPPVLR